MALILGKEALSVVNLLPLAILGVSLFFAGILQVLTIADLRDCKDLFVVLIMLGLTLATDLSVGFLIDIIAAYLLKGDKFSI